jgi:hypothetical protein
MKKAFALIIVFGVLNINNIYCAGRQERQERGNGNIITIEKIVPDFESIRNRSKGLVRIYKSDIFRVSVEADENLQKFIKTDVKNNHLTIDITNRARFIFTTFVVNVYTPSFTNISASGTGKIEIIDKIYVPIVRLSANGTGDVEGVIESGELNASLNGTGDINIRGFAGRANIRINGTGSFNGYELETRDVDIGINGTGDVIIWATETLVTRNSGTGKIEYRGNPRITSSGRIKYIE